MLSYNILNTLKFGILFCFWFEFAEHVHRLLSDITISDIFYLPLQIDSQFRVEMYCVRSYVCRGIDE